MTNTNLPKRFTKKPVTIEATYSPESAALAQSGQGEAVAICPNCNGSGAVAELSDASPDAHEVEVECPHCGGTGGLEDAYQGAVRLLRQMTAKWYQALPYMVAHQNQSKGLPPDLVPLRIEYEPGYPEDIAFGTQMQMDRLKKWLEKFFALRLAEKAREEAQPARVVGTVTGYQSAEGSQYWEFAPSLGADGLENQRFEVALSTPAAAPTPSQHAELRAALWHIKNTAISLADAQVIALEALAAHTKKEGA